MLAAASPAEAAADGDVEISVTIDGQSLGGAAVDLGAARATRVVVSVKNLTPAILEVDSVQLSGTVLGLTFFDYDTRVQTSVPSQGQANWTVDLDTRDLDGRATGLVPVEVAVRGRDLATVASVTGTADVGGSPVSLYGLFGLGLIILMGLLWAVALLPLGRHAIPNTGWQRGLRFVPAGCGVGLFSVFALSVLGLMVPSLPTDFVITLGAASACFAIGWITSGTTNTNRS